MPAYEYLNVVWFTKSNEAAIAKLPPGNYSGTYPGIGVTYHAEIWWPGATKADERQLGKDGVLEIYNELGRQGWRLVDRTVTHRTIEFGFHGYNRECSVPLQYSVIFEREISR